LLLLLLLLRRRRRRQAGERIAPNNENRIIDNTGKQFYTGSFSVLTKRNQRQVDGVYKLNRTEIQYYSIVAAITNWQAAGTIHATTGCMELWAELKANETLIKSCSTLNGIIIISGNEMLSAAIVLILVTIFTLVILFNINFLIQKIVVAGFFFVGISASAIAFLCIQRKAVLCIVVVGIVYWNADAILDWAG
jgi:hypothetical protein